MNVQLLLIDPQNDFCDPNGSLSVKGADQDIDRLATMIGRLNKKIDDIHVTLDSHHYFDVAHPVYWVDSNGKNPAPFTIIKAEDVENGTWNPAVPAFHKKALAYLKALKTSGRYDLCVWPYHCRIGTDGANVAPHLMDALTDWEKRPAMVNMVTKGSNIHTEHYSAVKAEVEDPEDPTTGLNTALIKTLMDADIIPIAGQAIDYCVANTVRDIADNFNDDSYISKMVLLQDATSAVGMVPALKDDFIRDMTARGMKLSTTVDFLN